MNIPTIVKILTKTTAFVAFWVVFLTSILLAPELTIMVLLFAFIKSLFASVLLWILLAILVDTLVKTMIADAQEQHVDRLKGGLSYHVTPPSEEELSAMDESKKQNEKTSKTKENLVG